MNLRRLAGIATGALAAYQLNHINEALAAGLKAETAPARIGSVLIGALLLMLLMLIVKRIFGKPFYHGFMVASGLFLSFDIVTFHWIFQLHRITNGPEANFLEPIFVVFGSALAWHGIRKEVAERPNSSSSTHSL